MPAFASGSWNAAFIHGSRHLLEGEMPAKLGKYGRESPSKFELLLPDFVRQDLCVANY